MYVTFFTYVNTHALGYTLPVNLLKQAPTYQPYSITNQVPNLQ